MLDIVIRNANDRETQTFQDTVSFEVVIRLFRVNRSVDLHDDTGHVAVEVDDEAMKQMLAAKLDALKSMTSKLCP